MSHEAVLSRNERATRGRQGLLIGHAISAPYFASLARGAAASVAFCVKRKLRERIKMPTPMNEVQNLSLLQDNRPSLALRKNGQLHKRFLAQVAGLSRVTARARR